MKQKLQKLVSCPLFYGLIIEFLLILLYFSNLNLKLNSLGIYQNKYNFVFLLVSISICTILFLLLYFYNKNKKIKYDKLFLIVSIILGTFYLFISPLFTGSDEHNHFYRIYEITDGVLVTPAKDVIGSELPGSLYKTFINGSNEVVNRNVNIKYGDLKDMYKIPLNKEVKEQYGIGYEKEYSNTALYSPLQYFPQIVGMFVGKALNLSPYLLGMLARLSNLIFYIAICTFAFKKLPKCKTLAFILMTSPTILSNATTLSADAFTNSLVFLFISCILYYCSNKQELDTKRKILLLFLSIMLASCKIVYLPLVMFLYLIPTDCFKTNKHKCLFITICLMMAVIFGFGWMHFTGQYFDTYYVNTQTQKNAILSNPFHYMIVVIRTYCQEFWNLLGNIFAGNNMYHSQLEIYSIVPFVYVILAVASILRENQKSYFSLKQKIFIVAVALIVIALISTAIYIQCTANFIELNHSTIVGLQGRYFIPIILVLTMVVGNINFKINDKLLVSSSILMQIPVLLTMLVRFMI